MFGLSLMLALLAGPEVKPLPGAVPSHAKNEYESGGKRVSGSWSTRPWRPTKFWRGVGGLLFCDDPTCPWCADAVYGAALWPDPPIPIRR